MTLPSEDFWALADFEWRAAAAGLKPLRLPRARLAAVRDIFFGPR